MNLWDDLQPHLHDATVTVTSRRAVSRFMIGWDYGICRHMTANCG